MLAELAAKHGVYHTMIAARDRQAVSESEVEKLHAKIGQLAVERDFLVKALG